MISYRYSVARLYIASTAKLNPLIAFAELLAQNQQALMLSGGDDQVSECRVEILTPGKLKLHPTRVY